MEKNKKIFMIFPIIICTMIPVIWYYSLMRFVEELGMTTIIILVIISIIASCLGMWLAYWMYDQEQSKGGK